jgi:hypothetical protein
LFQNFKKTTKIMKKVLSIALLICLSNQSMAQYAADLYRYSEVKTSGTTRFQSLGGNHAALGADASNFTGNPAGLAFYNRSELSIGLGLNNNNSNANYIGGSNGQSNSSSQINNASVVFSKPQSKTGSFRRTTWGIGFQRNNNLNYNFSYAGQNKRSSMVDYYTARANNLDLVAADFDKNIDKNGITGTTDQDLADVNLFYQGYLINPSTNKGAPYFRFDKNSAIDQSGSYDALGSNNQWSFSYAENYKDKIYWGLTAGFAFINYQSTNSFKEKNLTPTAFNGFDFTERLYVNGAGLLGSFGIMYKAASNLQIGASVSTPSFITISEGFTQTLTIDPLRIPSEDPKKPIVPEFLKLSTKEDVRTIDMRTPSKISGGATFFLKDKKGFITATVDYLNYNKMRAKINEAYFNPSDYNDDIKNEILSGYRSTVNMRIGAEYKISKIKLRAGIANIPNALKNVNDNINRNKMVYSAGFGLRNSNYFLDGGVNYTSFESAFTPYKLQSTADYSSVAIKTSQMNLSATIGRFF